MINLKIFFIKNHFLTHMENTQTQAIRAEIAKRHAITDIELSFRNDKSDIVITVTAENGNLFSRCVSMCSDDTPTTINLKFWDALQECENFMAGEYLRW